MRSYRPLTAADRDIGIRAATRNRLASLMAMESTQLDDERQMTGTGATTPQARNEYVMSMAGVCGADQLIPVDYSRMVYYSPSTNQAIDYLKADGKSRMFTGKLTDEAFKAAYPDAILMGEERAIKLKAEGDKLPAKRITRVRFWELLEVMYPEAWIQRGQTESFGLVEHWSGNVTTICCRIGDDYFEMRDDIRLSHDAIVRLARKAM